MPIAETLPDSGHVFVGWHTSTSDGYSHAVTETAFGRGIRQRRGQFHTECGLLICLAASVAPCGKPCPECTERLQTLTPKPTHDDAGPLHGGHMIPTTINGQHSQSVNEAFVALKRSGFTHYCCGDRRAPHVLVSAYDWGDYVDVINIRGGDRTTAARLPKHEDLDIFAPDQAVWHYMGSLEHAVTAILRLPPPHHPDAPTVTYPAPLTLFVSSREQRPMTIRPGK